MTPRGETTLIQPAVEIGWERGEIRGAGVRQQRKLLKDILRLFASETTSNVEQEVYSVSWWPPVLEGTEGGLWWGVTTLNPGKVGDEYFMTQGHFHLKDTRAEYYTAVSGKGVLLRMDRDGATWAEEMIPGSLLYIDGAHAHRVVNTGTQPLVFWACWPSDAGYDYGSIAESGFGLRVVERDGQPVLLASEASAK
jgi:glucose-6-phosphate isomerase